MYGQQKDYETEVNFEMALGEIIGELNQDFYAGMQLTPAGLRASMETVVSNIQAFVLKQGHNVDVYGKALAELRATRKVKKARTIMEEVQTQYATSAREIGMHAAKNKKLPGVDFL